MGILTSIGGGLSRAGSWLAPQSRAPAPPGPHPVTQQVAPDGWLLPHYRTFSGLANAFSRVYSARWDEAIKRFPADAQTMRNDCYLMALFDERTLPLTRWKWQVADEDDEAGASKKDPKREEVRSQLEAVLRRTWRLHAMREYHREAVWFGRYGSQVLWDTEVVGGQARKVIVRHLPVHGDKLFTDFDGHDAVALNAAAVGGGGQFGGEVTYTDRMPVLRLRNPEWRQRFVIQRWRVRDGDYFDPYSAGQVGGIGLRHYVYWAWWLRDEMLSWAMDFMQKVGSLGLLLFYFEEGNTQSEAAAKQAAKDASHRNALAVPLPKGKDPKTAGVDVIPANMTGVQFLKEFIADYFERHIERMFVGQSMSGGADAGDGLGGTGRADFAKDTKWHLLASDAEVFDGGYTEDLVRPALELNFPGCPYRFRWKHTLPDPEAEAKLAAAKTFTDMGGELEEEEVRETAGFREPRPDAKTLGGKGALGLGPDGTPLPPPVPPGGGEEGGAGARASGAGGNGTPKPAPANRVAAYMRDANGAEHSEQNGQFVSQGGGAGPDRAAAKEARRAGRKAKLAERKAARAGKKKAARAGKAEALEGEVAGKIAAAHPVAKRLGATALAAAAGSAAAAVRRAATAKQAVAAIRQGKREFLAAAKALAKAVRAAADDYAGGIAAPPAVRKAFARDLKAEFRDNDPAADVAVADRFDDAINAVEAGERAAAVDLLSEAIDAATGGGLADALSGDKARRDHAAAQELSRVPADRRKAYTSVDAVDGFDDARERVVESLAPARGETIEAYRERLTAAGVQALPDPHPEDRTARDYYEATLLEADGLPLYDFADHQLAAWHAGWEARHAAGTSPRQ